MKMSAETCQALASVLPLVIVTLVIERRAMRIKIRRQRWFRYGILAVLEISAISLGFVIGGTQAGGLTGGWAVVSWLLAITSLGGLALITLLSVASTEVDEDEAGA